MHEIKQSTLKILTASLLFLVSTISSVSVLTDLLISIAKQRKWIKLKKEQEAVGFSNSSAFVQTQLVFTSAKEQDNLYHFPFPMDAITKKYHSMCSE